jgi:hypothetical protein
LLQLYKIFGNSVFFIINNPFKSVRLCEMIRRERDPENHGSVPPPYNNGSAAPGYAAKTPTGYIQFPDLLWNRGTPAGRNFETAIGVDMKAKVDSDAIRLYVDRLIEKAKNLETLKDALAEEYHKKRDIPYRRFERSKLHHPESNPFSGGNANALVKTTSFIRFPDLLWQRGPSGMPEGPDLIYGITVEEIKDFVAKETQASYFQEQQKNELLEEFKRKQKLAQQE